jgi:ATP-dependent Clp protease ATP-binding subunit ClpA
LKRALQRNIEDPLAEELLANKFREGDIIKIILNKTEGIKFVKKDVKKESDNYIGVGTI